MKAADILSLMSASASQRVQTFTVLPEVDSTNSWLLKRPGPDTGKSEIVVALQQIAGRGRQGRAWLSDANGSVCVSLNWIFNKSHSELAGLSLAMGVCVRRALQAVGVKDCLLKWPNDIWRDGAKLSGILIESSIIRPHSNRVVVGIGLNYRLSPAFKSELMQQGMAVADLSPFAATGLQRTQILAGIIENVLLGLQQFAESGFAAFHTEWRDADMLLDRQVTLADADTTLAGIMRGVNGEGMLLLETADGLKKIAAGEVRLRLAE
jgi:BirA family transcriptional regulator, biotin operon repressor / biotin---[acetyl-CoA-carboxylase] ligase